MVSSYHNIVPVSFKTLIKIHLREGLFMVWVNDLATIDVMQLEIDPSLGKYPISGYSSVRREGVIDCFLALDLVHINLDLKYNVWSSEVDTNKRPKVGT
uniref:Uncharacterized protein n=1 Tax=Gibberella zeae (strain ATCC MYA-4620 / CBS 123657 / FGSC 9075 / NRRL 31084 / PH-1) TaxID=229533 RepID=A0A098DJV2_GIBZE